MMPKSVPRDSQKILVHGIARALSRRNATVDGNAFFCPRETTYGATRDFGTRTK